MHPTVSKVYFVSLFEVKISIGSSQHRDFGGLTCPIYRNLVLFLQTLHSLRALA